MSSAIDSRGQVPDRTVLLLRLAVGLVFGLALALLSEKIDSLGNFDAESRKLLQLWQQALWIAVSLTAFVLWAGLGTMRRFSLIGWSVASFCLLLLIAWTHLGNEMPISGRLFSATGALLLPLLFIAHELVSSGDQARSPVAPYRLYFDQAWKRGVQLGLSLLFTCLFWAILWLGAHLLGLIGFEWLDKALQEKYIALPLTGLALAASVNLSDVQTRLLDNVRALILGILAWLLPVIVVLGLIFSVSLFFSGLQPLWNTRAATGTLLSACLVLVLLVNAAFQQGEEERAVHTVLKTSARLAGLLIAVFAALSAVGLWLRIGQYGLTPQRIVALAGVVIALLYGLAYSVAALWPGAWLALVRPFNIGLAFVKVAILLAILTPVAPPWRLSVDDQVARLVSGRISPEAFDWNLLRFRTGSHGRQALKALETSDNAAISAKAIEAGKLESERPALPTTAVKPSEIALPQVVFPQGASLPQSFLDQPFEDAAFRLPPGFNRQSGDGGGALAALVDLDDDGIAEILWLERRGLYHFHFADGSWQIQHPRHQISEAGAKAFAEGRIETRRPRWNDLDLGGERIEMNQAY